jgi:type IV pilus assembly protein PilA
VAGPVDPGHRFDVYVIPSRAVSSSLEAGASIAAHHALQLREASDQGDYPVRSFRSFVARRRDAEEGFTLIELMVVVLIIAILIAIAVPTFLGARSRAQDVSAKSDLRNALTTEKTSYTDNQQYTATAATLAAIEPALKWGTALTVTVGSAVTGVTGDVVCMSEASKSGTVFSLTDIADGPTAGTYYNKGAACANPPATTGFSGW